MKSIFWYIFDNLNFFKKISWCLYNSSTALNYFNKHFIIQTYQSKQIINVGISSNHTSNNSLSRCRKLATSARLNMLIVQWTSLLVMKVGRWFQQLN